MSFFFKKSLGQHFLRDKNILERITTIKRIKDKFIIEIGPGQGALTKILLKKKPKKLIVIEKDESLKPFLYQIKGKHSNKLIIINDDALKIDYQKFNLKQIIIIANLPYNIATTLIIKLIQYFHIIDSMILMVQKEVAERLSAEVSSSSYGRISVLIQLHASIKKEFDVSSDSFYPKPKVESSVIQIKPNKNIEIDYKKLDKILKLSFQRRRKTIKNNLKTLDERIEKKILECGIDPILRPQDIKPSEYIKLANFLI